MERIIPARAGFTWPGIPRLCASRDHPRSRGVYAVRSRYAARSSGSSPLARGLRMVTVRVLRGIGIIPARAGFTAADGDADGVEEDHPRSRGVYTTMRSRLSSFTGSSPLARGLPTEMRAKILRPRIIPARAGFTMMRRRYRIPRQDHPRSRGVYARLLEGMALARGSSPLARGLRGNILGAVTQGGIIPARAGFTT